MKKSSTFFKKFSQFCDTMSDVESMSEDIKSDVEKLDNFNEDLDKVEFQKKLVARFNKLAKKFTEVANTLVEASVDADDAADQVPVELSKKFARVKRSFGELQEVMDTLTGEVSKASTVAASSVEVPQENESVENTEVDELQISFSKVVKTATNKISNLFKKFSEKLSDVAEDADELVEKFGETECTECNDSDKSSKEEKFSETESVDQESSESTEKSDEESNSDEAEDKGFTYTGKNPKFRNKGKFAMNKKFEKCPECGQEPCECNNSEVSDAKVAELAEKMEVVTSDVADLMKEEQVPEEVKENVVAAFTDMAENLDKYFESKGEDQSELAESFDKAEDAIKTFCGSIKSFAARRKANKIVKYFSEMPAIIQSIVESPTEETAETQKVETEVETADGKITIKEAGESLDKVIDNINGVGEVVKELGTSNFAKSLLRRARRIVCFSQEDLDKKESLISKYFEEVKEELDRDEVKPEEKAEDESAEAEKPEVAEEKKAEFSETQADEVKDETKEETKEESAEEVTEENANFSDKDQEAEETQESSEETEEVAEEGSSEVTEDAVKEFSEDAVDEAASESDEDQQAEEAQETEENQEAGEVQFGEDLTEETASVEDPALSMDSDVVEEVIGENMDFSDEQVSEPEKSDEDISDNKIVQFSKSSKSNPVSTYERWVESMC